MSVRGFFYLVSWFVVGVMAASFVVVMCFFGGFKSIKLGMYLTRFPDKQSVEFKDVIREFAGTLTENEISGFYAGYAGGRVWLWTLNGLQSFAIKEVIPALYFSDICQRETQTTFSDEGGTRVLKPNIMYDASVWSLRLRPGDYVQMRYFFDDRYRKMKLLDKASAFTGDMWMNASIKRQCDRI